MNWTDFFSYEPDTGRLLWKVRRPGGKSKPAGTEAGNLIARGRYLSVMVEGKRHYVHRIAWELVNGPIAAGLCIDHIDGDGLNNRLANLRLTTLSGNQRNRRLNRNSRTGVPGVFHHPRGGFSVYCANKYVGYSADLAIAAGMRQAAAASNGYLTTHPGDQS